MSFPGFAARVLTCAVLLFSRSALADEPIAAVESAAFGALIAPTQDLLVASLALSLCVVGALLAWITWLQLQERRIQRRVERDLSSSESRFRQMVEGSAQGVMLHRKGVLVFANQAYAEILGYRHPSEVLALESVNRIYAPHEIERMAGYQQARYEGRFAPTGYDFDALRKDGSVAILHNVVHLSVRDGRQVTQHNVTDVTERHRAEELLRESEERYRVMVQSAPEALVVLDVDTDRFIEANEHALRLFDVTREDLPQISPAALSPRSQPDGVISAHQIAKNIENTDQGVVMTDAKRVRRMPSAIWISTSSRSSTTPVVMPPVTSCCASWEPSCARTFASPMFDQSVRRLGDR